MGRAIAIVIAAFILVSASAAPQQTSAAAEPSELEGALLPTTWYAGDGLGVNINLHLHADSSYVATWDGCLGRYGSAAGSYSWTGDTLDLIPSREDGMLEGFLRKLRFASSPEGPRLRLLRRADGGAWVAEPHFEFAPVEKPLDRPQEAVLGPAPQGAPRACGHRQSGS